MKNNNNNNVITNNNSTSNNNSNSNNNDEDNDNNNKVVTTTTSSTTSTSTSAVIDKSILHGLELSSTYIDIGINNLLNTNNKLIRSLLIHRKLPQYGWSNHDIQYLLYIISTLDTNNKNTTNSNTTIPRWCGVGEREGRVYNSIVQERHYGLSHGIGRSGDINEAQPKAIGSTIIAKLTNCLILDAIQRCSNIQLTIEKDEKEKKSDDNTNVKHIQSMHTMVLPLCTGMTISLVLRSLCNKENNNKRNIVLWSRIDQKSCLKAIYAAGLTCIVIPTKIDGDAVVTDLDAMKNAIETYNDNILAIISTTSCFAPRVPDKIDEIANLAKQYNIYHIINNAYGLQCTNIISKLINRSCIVGRVDIIISSTDKNFLVPIGGAIVYTNQQAIINTISSIYAGRASITPILDVFITLLSMGINGYKQLLQQRQNLINDFKTKFENIATKYNERLLSCPTNTISYAMTLNTLADEDTDDNTNNTNTTDISMLGSMLFKRCVSGTRVITKNVTKTIMGHTFHSYGSSVNDYQHHYITAACAIGLSEIEMNEFFIRLDKTIKEYIKLKNKQLKKKQEEEEVNKKY